MTTVSRFSSGGATFPPSRVSPDTEKRRPKSALSIGEIQKNTVFSKRSKKTEKIKKKRKKAKGGKNKKGERGKKRPKKEEKEKKKKGTGEEKQRRRKNNYI